MLFATIPLRVLYLLELLNLRKLATFLWWTQAQIYYLFILVWCAIGVLVYQGLSVGSLAL